ncbi:MAG: fructosamine kinase family protein [Ekhidna sp.]|nr:fructosamine kinase family protein [Ekhidna sp.]
MDYEKILSKHFTSSTLVSVATVCGGCINNTAKLITSNGTCFLKWNNSSLEKMLECEKRGLETLSKNTNLLVPKILGYGTIDSYAYLLLEWIDKGSSSTRFWNQFGEGLAELHQVSNESFGLLYDNFIGSLPQRNTQSEDWSSFFTNTRLKPLVDRATSNNLMTTQTANAFEKLYTKLKNLIPDEPPSLIHGDLWSGNYIVSTDHKAAIFDPAIHYGHRETELAFTTLFGGFDSKFYDAYQATFPLERGFQERFDIHNLYPLMVL